jgi:hypothetical protein
VEHPYHSQLGQQLRSGGGGQQAAPARPGSELRHSSRR